MSYFDQAIKKAFPPAAPPRPYSYPAFIRETTVTQLTTTTIVQAGPGKRVPLAVRTVSVKGLVTTYRFVPAVFTRIGPIRLAKPPQTFLPRDTKKTPGSSAQGASTGRRSFDPYGDFAFHVEIEGLGVLAFQKFDGVDVEIDQIEYKDSLDTHPHKRPGIYRFGNLKLTKGVISNTDLWKWIHDAMAGNVQRRNGSIHVLSDNHDKTKPEVTYNFYQAWPCKWSGLRLDGKGQGALVEELELAVDYVARGK